MAEYALVGIDTKVKAVIVADADFVTTHGNEIRAQYGDAAGSWILTPDKVGIGYKEGNGIFVAPMSDLSVIAPAAISLGVSAVADGVKSYQWKKGEDNIQDATSASLSIDPSAVGDSGSYSCVVTVGGNSVTSDASTVTVSAE